MNREELIFHCQKSLFTGYARLLLNYDLWFEHPLPAGPKIFVANHPTTTDPLLLPLLVNDPIYLVITQMAFDVPLLGSILREAGHIPVPVGQGNGEEIINAAVQRLKAGKTVGIFPEGHLSPAIGEYCPPRTGAARIALLSGAPVIPVGIHLSKGAYHETRTAEPARIACRGSYYLTVGKPLTFTGDVENRERVREVSGQIMNAIANQAQVSARRMESRQIKWSPIIGKAMR